MQKRKWSRHGLSRRVIQTMFCSSISSICLNGKLRNLCCYSYLYVDVDLHLETLPTYFHTNQLCSRLYARLYCRVGDNSKGLPPALTVHFLSNGLNRKIFIVYISEKAHETFLFDRRYLNVREVEVIYHILNKYTNVL